MKTWGLGAPSAPWPHPNFSLGLQKAASRITSAWLCLAGVKAKGLKAEDLPSALMNSFGVIRVQLSVSANVNERSVEFFSYLFFDLATCVVAPALLDLAF